MSFFILNAFQTAFGISPDEKTATAFAGARNSGMRDLTIVMEIYRTKRELAERGNLNKQNPGKAVVQRLRDMYRRGIR